MMNCAREFRLFFAISKHWNKLFAHEIGHPRACASICRRTISHKLSAPKRKRTRSSWVSHKLSAPKRKRTRPSWVSHKRTSRIMRKTHNKKSTLLGTSSKTSPTPAIAMQCRYCVLLAVSRRSNIDDDK